jgi:hypothetical protein
MQNESKRVWEAIRDIVKKICFMNEVKLGEWVNHFYKLFFRNKERKINFETKIFGPNT